jgi:hypothetical protein
MGQPARVIDLDAARAKRNPQKQTPRPFAAAAAAGPVFWVPVVVWVPCWNVA